MNRLSRLLAGLAAMATLGMTGPASAQALQEITIGLSSATLTTAPLRIAKEMGIFARHGLDPKFVTMESGNASTSALISGAIKIALAGPGDLVVAQARGQKIVIIANTYRGLGGTLVISRAAADKLGISPTAPVNERLKALDGLLIAVPSPTGTYTVALKGAATAAGASNLRFTYMASAPMAPALETNAIQGYFTSAPFWAPVVFRNTGVVWLSGPKGEVPAAFSPVNSVSVLVTRDFAEANRDLMKKIVTVIDEFIAALNAKPAEVKAVTAKLFPDLDAQTFDLLFAAESVAWRTKPVSAAEMAQEIKFVKENGAAIEGIDKLDPAAMVFP